ncbi:MAG: hypothetical protein K1X74_13670 [Pirellulales bacterium]|nr:hypothetical protein [Pirellulales bacterium]
MIARARLAEFLADFPRRKIALLGDLFLDRYLDIDPDLHELSVETGLEAYQVTRIRNSPGALGTVINNLAALGVGRLLPVSTIGDDGQAYDLMQELARLPVDPAGIVQDPARRTPTYTKPMQRQPDGSWRELNRLDLRNRAVPSAATEEEVIARLDRAFADADGLIVLDQVNEEGWGVVTPRLREHLVELTRRDPAKLIFVDSRAQIARFRCGTLKPNLRECLLALGRPESDDPELGRAAARELARQLGLRLFCTMGAAGILVVEPSGQGGPAAQGSSAETTDLLVPGYPVGGPIDPVGAGDSATSGIVASLLCGATAVEAAAVGNLVASITVQQLGTTGTASPGQVLARWDEAH